MTPCPTPVQPLSRPGLFPWPSHKVGYGANFGTYPPKKWSADPTEPVFYPSEASGGPNLAFFSPKRTLPPCAPLSGGEGNF